MIFFTWDENKRLNNIKKHGIDFYEAEESFYDENSLFFNDPDHSDNEERFILIGFSKKGNLLVVVHCYRENEQIIRIISARKATKNESLIYERKRMI